MMASTVLLSVKYWLNFAQVRYKEDPKLWVFGPDIGKIHVYSMWYLTIKRK